MSGLSTNFGFSVSGGLSPDVGFSIGGGLSPDFGHGTVPSGPPVNVVPPHISGLPNVGQIASCSTGAWDGELPIVYTFQWKRGAANISGATSQTYTLQAADLGTLVSCDVLATNSAGNSTWTTDPIGPISPALEAPVNVVPPSVTGNTVSGSVLTCVGGTWTGYPTVIPSYQWKRDGSTILGASSNTYLLTATDETHTIKCTVTGTNSQGSSTADSNIVGPVTAFVPEWQQFDGAAWLLKSDDLTGIPTNSTGFISAATYSPSAADIASGANRNFLLPVATVNRLLNIGKGGSNGLLATAENTADAALWNCNGGVGLFVSGGHYLTLFSVDPTTAGGKGRVIDLATGSVIISVDDVDTGTLGGPSATGWVIAAGGAAGANAMNGQMERVMLWANTYADAGDSAVQALFHVDGALQNPTIAIASIGTPHISIAGSSLQTGTNAGSGGNFTKTGAGSISPAV